jgi:nucleoside phosphorylase/CheY-like chemotaxis protein
MLRILIVEDDTVKFGRVYRTLTSDGVNESDIYHVVCAAQALECLRAVHYDLMLLDVNLPRRMGDNPTRGGGMEVLRELGRDADLQRPRYIVGITAFEDVVAEFGGAFDDQLWSLMHYSETSDRWVSQLRLKLSYIRALKKSEHFSDGVTYGGDLAIVCALDTVEFEAVRRLACDWQPLRLPHDETRYLSGNIPSQERAFSVIAAAAPRMGMPATSVLCAKIIHQFRPRYLVMVGICAGRAEKVHLGDIIVADPTWDWGSGKVISDKNTPKFLPSPHQLDLDGDIVSSLKDLSDDKAGLTSLKQNARGTQPPFELVVHFGPLASGAAVVAHKPTFDALLTQHRGLLGVDMEAYGVAAAAIGSGKPRPTALIIKGVCDYADKDKGDDYQEYAASVSAGFLYRAAQHFL